MSREDVASAIACFERSDDMAFLRDVLRAIRPRAEAAARRYEQQGRDAPPPLDVDAAGEAATPQQAMATVRAVKSFEELQAMARAAGRRAEELAAQQG